MLPQSLSEYRPRNWPGGLIAAGVVVALLYYGRALLVTLITATTISFLLEPFVVLTMKLRLPRSVASFLVCLLTLMCLYALGFGMYTQAAALWDDLPKYSQRISEIGDEVAAALEAVERDAYRTLLPRRWKELQEQQKPAPPPEPATRRRRTAEPPLPIPPGPPPVTEVRIRPDRSPVVDYVYRYWQELYHFALLASFVPFLVYFMLSWRDHLHRAFLHLFHGPGRHAAGRSWQGIADMARAYVVGNFILGIFLTVASSVFFWSISLPYFLLVAPLSAFFSLIPYIGLPLAALPPLLAALPVYTKMAPYLVIFAVVGFLHLLALNLLYPKLVGSRVHMNPLAATVALMFWGSLWGAVGLVLAIPITAGIKAVFDNVPALQPYGKLMGD